MQFLADENVDSRVIQALRQAGHDVLAAISELAGAADEEITARALEEGRVLLTEDRDFGRIVFALSKGVVAVIYMRYRAGARSQLPSAVVDLVARDANRIVGAFVVMQPGRLRFSRLP